MLLLLLAARSLARGARQGSVPAGPHASTVPRPTDRRTQDRGFEPASPGGVGAARNTRAAGAVTVKLPGGCGPFRGSADGSSARIPHSRSSQLPVPVQGATKPTVGAPGFGRPLPVELRHQPENLGGDWTLVLEASLALGIWREELSPPVPIAVPIRRRNSRDAPDYSARDLRAHLSFLDGEHTRPACGSRRPAETLVDCSHSDASFAAPPGTDNKCRRNRAGRPVLHARGVRSPSKRLRCACDLIGDSTDHLWTVGHRVPLDNPPVQCRQPCPFPAFLPRPLHRGSPATPFPKRGKAGALQRIWKSPPFFLSQRALESV